MPGKTKTDAERAKLDEQASGDTTEDNYQLPEGVSTAITRGEKEWDTCAPELIVREAGGLVTDGDGRPLAYNQADVDRPRGIVASNGVSHQALLAAVAPLL